MEFENCENARPRWWCFCVSLLLGAGLLLWFFVSNADRIHGSMIVYIGLPLGLACGAGCSLAWQLRHKLVHVGGLKEQGVVAMLLGEQEAVMMSAPTCGADDSNAGEQAGAYRLWDDNLNQVENIH